jgi:hypothetical protein
VFGIEPQWCSEDIAVVFGISGEEGVRVVYHGHNEIEVEVGSLLRYQAVSGVWGWGVFLGVDCGVWPRNISYVRVLTGSGVDRINSNLIFRMEVV